MDLVFRRLDGLVLRLLHRALDQFLRQPFTMQGIPKSKPLFQCLALLAAASSLQAQPNILLIMTDDQGIGQMAFSNEHRDPATLWRPEGTSRYQVDVEDALEAAQAAMPNLERLARTGVRFTNAFVASPVCSPSRAAVLTARYPQRFGIYSNDDAMEGVPVTEVFLPGIFQQAGYRTAMIGKWHVGKATRKNLPEKTRDYHMNAIVGTVPEHHPLERGFDYYFGFNRSGSGYYNPTSIFRNHENVEVPGYLTEAFTREAVEFIETRGSQPFLVFLSYNAPHIPLHVPAPACYLERFDTGNPHVDNYYASLAAVDDGIGRILDTLKARGELEKTLIFFISDNGAVIDSPLPMNGSLKGNKGTLLRGGVQVPFIVKYGSRFVPGSTRSQLASSMDIFPTAIEFAGLQPSEIPQLDGQSLAEVLRNPSEAQSPHQFLFWAGPHALHWSPENVDFWKDYFAYVTGREGEIGDVPASPYVEAKAPWALAATDGHSFLEWTRQAGGESWTIQCQSLLFPSTESVSSTDLLQAARDWLLPMPAPVKWHAQ
jgi:uncharacterized sulfatase